MYKKGSKEVCLCDAGRERDREKGGEEGGEEAASGREEPRRNVRNGRGCHWPAENGVCNATAGTMADNQLKRDQHSSSDLPETPSVVPRRRALPRPRPVDALRPRTHLPLSPHELERLRKVRLHAKGDEVLRRLLDALDLLCEIPVLALAEAAPDDVDHGGVEAGVEVAAGSNVVVVCRVEPAVRVEVSAELEHEVEGVAGSRGQLGEALDVG